MAEYIERSYIRKMAMFEMAYTMETETDAAVVLRMIDDAPAADVAPVVWIPVTDRLPEVGTRSNGWADVTVIATNGKFVRPLIYERAIVRGKVVWRWKWLWDRIYDGNPVTHWMSLPEPPKGMSDNG